MFEENRITGELFATEAEPQQTQAAKHTFKKTASFVLNVHMWNKRHPGAEEGSMLSGICYRSTILDHYHIFVGGLNTQLKGSECIKISRSTQPDNLSLSLYWLCDYVIQEDI